MKSIILCILATTLFLPFWVQAKESCDKALDLIPKFDSSKEMFKEIHQFKLKFGHCMDGSIAASVSSIIVESLDKKWSEIDGLSALSKKDSSFQKFILSNIQPNVTEQEAEVKSIIDKAKKSCPKEMKSFCRKLVKSCELSLKSE